MPCNMDEIKTIAKKNKLAVIEDACHALGATYRDSKIGGCSYSDMCIFSFHPVKHITTGEGGMITTNSKEIYEDLLMLRTHGITKNKSRFKKFIDAPWYYEMQKLGYNYRLTDIQAALGISQLKKAEGFVSRRRVIASKYDSAFKDSNNFDIIRQEKFSQSSYHLYPILLKDRFLSKKKNIFLNLMQKGVGVQVHYIPVYQHPYYRNLGYKQNLCPVAEDFYNREISIPMYPAMQDKDIDFVIKTLNEVFEELS
jgi:dTDP-4-amino-4,6-dideoxygalactose transaminase